MSAVLRFSLILLGAALLAVLARAMFVNQHDEPPPQPDLQIRVSAAELPAGLLLRDGDLAWKPVKPGAVPQGAIVEGTPQAAKLGGAMLRGKLAVGEPVLATNIIRPDAPGFLAAVLAPGMRAVSVAIDDVSGNAGLIQPGDHVDMILTQNLERGGQKTMVSETVVEKVRIIAVGSTFSPQRDSTGAANRARTITVEANPRAAEAITVASHLGILSLALRSFATTDREMAEVSEGATIVAQSPDKNDGGLIWGGQVSRALQSQDRALPPIPPGGVSGPLKQRSITVFRGGDKQDLTF